MSPLSLTYDSLGAPVVSASGDLPDLYPAGVPWMVLGGGGGVYQPEYDGAFGMVMGDAAAGLRWGATIMTANPEDQEQAVADWSVQAALFEADGRPVAPLSCRVLGAKAWAVDLPVLPAGPKRVMIVMVTARKPGVATTMRTPGLLLVAAS